MLLELEGASGATSITIHLEPGSVSGRPKAPPLPPVDTSMKLGQMREGRFTQELTVPDKATGKSNVDLISMQVCDPDASPDQEF